MIISRHANTQTMTITSATTAANPHPFIYRDRHISSMDAYKKKTVPTPPFVAWHSIMSVLCLSLFGKVIAKALHLVPGSTREIGDGNRCRMILERDARQLAYTAPFCQVVNIHIER